MTPIGFAYIALVSAEFIAVDKGIGFLIMDSRLNLSDVSDGRRDILIGPPGGRQSDLV